VEVIQKILTEAACFCGYKEVKRLPLGSLDLFYYLVRSFIFPQFLDFDFFFQPGFNPFPFQETKITVTAESFEVGEEAS
jgi:hypothetical protein